MMGRSSWLMVSDKHKLDSVKITLLFWYTLVSLLLWGLYSKVGQILVKSKLIYPESIYIVEGI